MGFSIRVAKGVRLRATSRGLGLSVGRGRSFAWVGGGRGVGISVPVAGSLRYYTRIGGGRSTGARRPTLAQYERQVQQARQLEEMRGLAGQLEQMVSIHQQEFPIAQRPVAPPIQPVDSEAILKRHQKEQLRGIPIHRFGERKKAKAQAQALAEEEVRNEEEARERERAAYQAELDDLWDALLANDPQAVLETLDASFADNAAPAVPVNCEDGRATVVMLIEGEEAVPEKRPTFTPTGRPTLKKFTQTEKSQFYQAWLASNLLVTLKEAFAVAPSLTAVTAVVLRQFLNPFGEQDLSVLYCGTFTRERFERLDFSKPEALDAIFYAEDLRITPKGKARKLVPLDLSKDPELAGIVVRVREALKAQATTTGQS